MTNRPFKPKSKIWKPPSKTQHKQKEGQLKAMGCLSGLQKYVGASKKGTAKRSKAPTGQLFEVYAQGKELNSAFLWQSKAGLVEIQTLETSHLVSILGYLYWGNKKHNWLTDPDRSKTYHQHAMTFTGAYVREAFDAVVVELVKLRKHELTPPLVDSVRKIVKHIVVVRSKIKKKEAKQLDKTA